MGQKVHISETDGLIPSSAEFDLSKRMTEVRKLRKRVHQAETAAVRKRIISRNDSSVQASIR